MDDGGFQPVAAILSPGSTIALFGVIGGMAIGNGEGLLYGTIIAGTNDGDAIGSLSVACN